MRQSAGRTAIRLSVGIAAAFAWVALFGVLISSVQAHEETLRPVEVRILEGEIRASVEHHLEEPIGDGEVLDVEAAGRLARFYQVNLKLELDGKRIELRPDEEGVVCAIHGGEDVLVVLKGAAEPEAERMRLRIGRAISGVEMTVLGREGKVIAEEAIAKGGSSPEIELR